MSNQSISIAIEGIDKFSAPAKKIASSSDKMVSLLSAGTKEIKELSDKAGQVSKLQKLELSMGKVAQQMGDSRNNVKKLAKQLSHAESKSQALNEQFKSGKQALEQQINQHKDLTANLSSSAKQLKNSRQKVKALSAQITKAKTPSKQLTAQLKKAEAVNSSLEESHKVLAVSVTNSAKKLTLAKEKIKNLAKESSVASKETQRLGRAFKQAQNKSARLGNQHSKQRKELRLLKDSLKSAGIEGRNFAQTQEKIKQKMEATNRRLEEAARLNSKLEKAQQQYDAKLQKAANMTIVAHGAQEVGRTVSSMLSNPVSQMRYVEKSKGELSSLGVKDLDAIIDVGNKLASTFSGMNTASFVAAAYDIKSGISTLDDAGIASMTRSAALTAKATKASVEQMTSLFATSYGSFKETLFSDVDASEFGDIFSGQLSASVESFKTDGGKMQQAIESMGSGLAASGVSMSEQLAGLGMLQQKMSAGEAGTVLKSIEANAANAQARFEKMGYAIKTLDENGNLRSLPDLLQDVQKEFGGEYTTEIGDKIKTAFGTDESSKYFKALWGQDKVYRKNAEALRLAGEQGQLFTQKMALAMDNNMDARLNVLSQKWDIIKQKIGYALVPALETFINVISPVIDWLSGLIGRFPTLTAVGVGTVAVIGGLAAVVGTVAMAGSALTVVMARLGLTMKKNALGASLSSVGGGVDGGGKKAKKSRFSGRQKIGAVGAAVGGLMLFDTLSNDQATTSEKIKASSQTIGGVGGAMAGAAAGAIVGSVVPIVGTAIGGFVGGMLGGWAGDGLGGDIGNMIASAVGDDNSFNNRANQQLARTDTVSSSVKSVVNNNPVFNITQQPGEDQEMLAQRVNQLNHEQLMRLETDVR